MKKIFLTLALTLGVLAVAAEARSHRNSNQIAATAFDAPPPNCWPLCGMQ